MANVQKENGYTAVANEILEAIQTFKFTLNEMKVIMCVWRYTYGFNRKSHQLSLGFFEKHTGLSRSRINGSLKRLLECNVLLKTGQGNAKTSNVYSFNKNYESWKVEKYSSFTSEQIETSVPNDTSIQNGTSTSVQGGTATSVQDGTKERHIKDNNKETVYNEIFNLYLSKNIIQHKKLTDPMKRAINGRLKDYSLDEIKKAIENYAKVLCSDNHWFTHKYPLADLMRDKDLRKFLDEADPLYNFAKDKNKVIQLNSTRPTKSREQIEHERMLAEMGMK